MSSPPSSSVSTADLTARLQSWLFESAMFESMVEWAKARAAAVPADALSSKGEMRLAFTALHAEFEAFFDSKLEKFCLDAGATAEQVHAQLAAALAAGGAEAGGAGELVSFVTALADFDVFMQMMTDVRKQADAEAAAAAAAAAAAPDGAGAGAGAEPAATPANAVPA
jgi:hypothetical protein